MHPVSCTNTHHDVTDLVNHGMVKNTKTWISWERNITFLWNKKILNLFLLWHILIGYCFAVKVTFNWIYCGIKLKDECFPSNICVNKKTMILLKATSHGTAILSPTPLAFFDNCFAPIKPISLYWSLSIPPENHQKTSGFSDTFRAYWKRSAGRKWLKREVGIKYHQALHRA